MANYLPVLLVSVSTNAIPDDSSLVTLPRAQVDYLSHDWQEEDVWRSWRNMTRQKNEIANGIRLENASWRTWWKQRNKLKTITPETLNWLKDSDVTWLYGPFHSAVEWTPTPKPNPVPDSVNQPLASAHDRLDLSTPSSNPRHPPHPRQGAPAKPILKHRSISELLLASGEPSSPIFSPAESEDEDEEDKEEKRGGDVAQPLHHHPHRRPLLSHTKSDTHITRWGPSRAFRKESPPRIDPPGHVSNPPSPHSSNSNLAGYFTRGPGQVSTSTSIDSHNSASTTSISNGYNSHSNGGSGERKKKHISFNTFVEQCIAIEKPKKSGSVTGFGGEGQWIGYGSGDDDGYEEDQEDVSPDEEDSVWHTLTGSAIRGISESPFADDKGYEEEEEEGNNEAEYEDEDDIIEMRSSSYLRNSSTRKKKQPRSQSKVSTASSSSSASTSTASTASTSSSHTAPSIQRQYSNGGVTPSQRNRRSSNSTYRPTRRPPPLIRTPSDHVQHVTIAPIAPTILKTGAWAEGFGDDGGASDDGFSWGRWGDKGKGREDSDHGGNNGTPVELVYVPPFGSNYSLHVADDGEEEEEEAEEAEEEEEGYEEEFLEQAGEDVVQHPPSAHYHRRHQRQMEVREDHVDEDKSPHVGLFHHPGGGFGDYPDVTPASVAVARARSTIPSIGTAPIPVPTVVEPGRDVEDEDPMHFFDGPSAGDLGGEEYAGFFSNTPKVSSHLSDGNPRKAYKDVYPRRAGSGSGGDGVSRVIVDSRSRSRTPSPQVVASPTSYLVRGRSSSVSPSSPSSLLSPTSRGRSFQDLPSHQQQQQGGRGRSTTRTPSTSSSMSDRERASLSSSSPMGSLSPDSSAGLGSIGVAYAGGRIDREREREKEKELRELGRGEGGRERGRDRTGKRLSVSASPNAVGPATPSRAGEPPSEKQQILNLGPGENAPLESAKKVRATPSQASLAYAESVSSASSGNTAIPPEGQQHDNVAKRMEEEFEQRAEEELLRKIHPTPSNSPIFTMQPPPRAVVQASPATNSTVSATSSLSPKLKSPLPIPSPPLAVQATTSSSAPAERLSVSIPPSTSSPLGGSSSSSTSQTPQPQSPKVPISPGKEGRIMGKAVEMVSNAGAYFGFWQHNPGGTDQ